MENTSPVNPPYDEACSEVGTSPSGYFSAPGDLVQAGEENRLVTELRSAAQSRDATEILTRAVVSAVRSVQPGSAVPASLSAALADLAVSGRNAAAGYLLSAPDPKVVADRAEWLLINVWGIDAPYAVVYRWAGDILARAEAVNQALRGAPDVRQSERCALGWIAVSGEDDPPDRPVNVPSSPYPQFDLDVLVHGRYIRTRYLIASSSRTWPVPSIPPGDDVFVFLHGHSSRAEEAADLIPQLRRAVATRGRSASIIAMDLPSCGYSAMIDHTEIAPSAASAYPGGYPLLEFLDDFVIAFVEQLEEALDQNGLSGGTPLRQRIRAIVGGSLGGNLGLRLGERIDLQHLWCRNIVSWSPASVWTTFADDLVKGIAVSKVRDRMDYQETSTSRHDHFQWAFDDGAPLVPAQPQMWYRDDWQPCKTLHIEGARLDRQEIYNPAFRRWHWRLALEQLLFSHRSTDTPDGQPRYESLRSNTLLCSGADDDYAWSNIYTATRTLAALASGTPGTSLFVRSTGHSIHNERPGVLSGAICRFIYDTGWPTQTAWSRCANCLVLFCTVGPPSTCSAAYGSHRAVQGQKFGPVINSREYPGQFGWARCRQCQGMYFPGSGGSICAKGGHHAVGDGCVYSLNHETAAPEGTQSGWRWCHKCSLLFLNAYGACPAGGLHDGSYSWNYNVPLG